ncbi:hypothetical protein J6590_068549 [Homalodisca vitripennis]|nr:hypothetical protein J6590_068549 [Homalodisca vitripennis]
MDDLAAHQLLQVYSLPWAGVTIDTPVNENVTNVSIQSIDRPNITNKNSDIDPKIVIYTTSFLILCCIVSLAVNIVILSSVCFMRSKVYPTLYISLSLAGADTFSLFLYALGLVLFTLVPRGFGISLLADCTSLVVEALRMGAVLTTMFHLLALAGNHYLGILQPLKYPVYMTRSTVRTIALLLWTIPSVLLIIDIFIVEGSAYNSCSHLFLRRAKFRTTFALLFFTTLGVMLFIYCHIYILVDKHHKKPIVGKHHCSKKRRHQSRNTSFTKSQVNEKVIVTTLMILGSVIIGWLPVFTYFILCCDDCWLKDWWQLKTYSEHAFLVLINFLMICKTASNSYIYACRMKELKIALRGMKKLVVKHFTTRGTSNKDPSVPLRNSTFPPWE